MEQLDFSEKAVFTGPLPCFSPDGKYIALAQEYRLVLRDVETMAVVNLFCCLESIESIAWSPYGDLLLCGMYNRGTAQVFSISDPEWSCSITEGLAGISAVKWAPSGEHVLISSDFQVKMSVWSLVDQSCINLPASKFSEAGVAFSPDGAKLAILQRYECKDWLTIFSTDTWDVQTQFPLSTIDATDLSWSPDSSSIAVWDSISQGPFVCIVNPLSGECVAKHRSDGYGLGYKSVSWSPSGQLLALGSYEQDACVLNNVTWTSLGSFHHSQVVNGPSSVIIYKEDLFLQTNTHEEQENHKISGNALQAGNNSISQLKGGKNNFSTKEATSLFSVPSPTRTAAGVTGSNHSQHPRIKSPRKPPLSASARGVATQRMAATLAGQLDNPMSFLGENLDDGATSSYVLSDLPLKLPALRNPTDRPNPKTGISLMAWSPDGMYMATRCDDRPNVLWIWDCSKLELASMLVQTAAIRSMAWMPPTISGDAKNRLAIACGSNRIYFWTPLGASCAHVPVQDMKVLSLAWNCDGRSLLVASKDVIVCAYLDLEDFGYIKGIE